MSTCSFNSTLQLLLQQAQKLTPTTAVRLSWCSSKFSTDCEVKLSFSQFSSLDIAHVCTLVVRVTQTERRRRGRRCIRVKSEEIFSVSLSLYSRVFPRVKMVRMLSGRRRPVVALWTCRETFLSMLWLWIPTQLEGCIKVRKRRIKGQRREKERVYSRCTQRCGLTAGSKCGRCCSDDEEGVSGGEKLTWLSPRSHFLWHLQDGQIKGGEGATHRVVSWLTI